MITVLRIGHRLERDKRITTHVALVARAFGAREILVDVKDSELEKTFAGVCERFGGDVNIKTGVNWRSIMKSWDGQVIHLTMYGEELETAMSDLDSGRNTLIIVGAEKVPREVYENADLNVAVGNQPHSEVAALAVFLYRYSDFKLIKLEGGQMKIIPDKRGKTVVEK